MRPPTFSLLSKLESKPTMEAFARVAKEGLAHMCEALGRPILRTRMEAGVVVVDPKNPLFLKALEESLGTQNQTVLFVRWGEGAGEWECLALVAHRDQDRSYLMAVWVGEDGMAAIRARIGHLDLDFRPPEERFHRLRDQTPN